jgi:hypothetical protein
VAKMVEQMPYRGESAQDRATFARYIDDVKRGKSLIALVAMRNALTPEIRKSWYAGAFTPIETPQGRFDELTCEEPGDGQEVHQSFSSCDKNASL